MTKHTPGPWNIAKGISYLDESVSWMIPGVAHCGDGECSEANARLIAAAPELLAALKAIIALSDRKHTAWDQAKAAIAKATEE